MSISVCHIRSSDLGVSRSHSAATCVTNHPTCLEQIEPRLSVARIIPYHSSRNQIRILGALYFSLHHHGGTEPYGDVFFMA